MCLHSNHTFPITPRTGPRAGQTYVACLRCGAELEYDWKRMCVGGKLDDNTAPRPIGEVQRAAYHVFQMLLAPFVWTIRSGS